MCAADYYSLDAVDPDIHPITRQLTILENYEGNVKWIFSSNSSNVTSHNTNTISCCIVII